MMHARKNSTCRYCGSNDLVCFLSLGQHPPSDAFIRPERVESEQRFPLDVYFCQGCSLVQLLDVIAPEDLFGEYVYLASSSKALKDHYAKLCVRLTNRMQLASGDAVVDIGCNDGVLLSGYTMPGLIRVGVEPSSVAQVAAEAGFVIFREFFGASVASKIVSAHGRAKVVTATNVFPHVDEIGKFVEALPTLMDDDGIFVIEASYLLNLIDETLFDTIYHEHLCYLSLTPMVPFLAKYGLEIFDAEREPFGASGPAVRVWIRKTSKRRVESSVATMLAEEAAWGVGNLDRYRGYAKKVDKVKHDLLALLQRIRATGARIGGYGAPAKGNTLLNYVGITTDMIDCIAETNRLKQGMLTPGTHIPIVGEESFLERMPPYALLLTWNYLDFFLKNSPYIRAGGRFIVPIPSPRITP